MSRSVKGSWIGVGLLFFALLIAILLELETISYAFGTMLSAALWLAVGRSFPKRLSEYSTGQKIFLGVIIVSIMVITAILVCHVPRSLALPGPLPDDGHRLH